MPPSDYLNTCTNIPALPSGWNWYLSAHQVNHASAVRPGELVNWTKLYVSIADSNGKEIGSHVVSILTEHIERELDGHIKLSGYLSGELVNGCYAAYRSMYPENKLDINKALEHLV